jgi:hypothetical protein
MDLADHINDHESVGCSDVSGSLGIVQMPAGYALMLDADRMYHYWLRSDGAESVIHWNKWAVYRGAVKDYAARPTPEAKERT